MVLDLIEKLVDRTLQLLEVRANNRSAELAKIQAVWQEFENLAEYYRKVFRFALEKLRNDAWGPSEIKTYFGDEMALSGAKRVKLLHLCDRLEHALKYSDEDEVAAFLTNIKRFFVPDHGHPDAGDPYKVVAEWNIPLGGASSELSDIWLSKDSTDAQRKAAYTLVGWSKLMTHQYHEVLAAYRHLEERLSS